MRLIPFSRLALTAIFLALFACTADSRAAQDKPAGTLEVAATFSGAMPTGVAVSHKNRIFVTFPRWGDPVPFTVAEVVGGRAVPYPNAEINAWPGLGNEHADVFGYHSGRERGLNETHFVSAQAVVVDAVDRLWVLDSGAPMQKLALLGAPKLVCIDLATNKVIRNISLDLVAGKNSYMNDVRFDLRVGTRAVPDIIHGTAYISDSSKEGPNGLVIVDLASGIAWRKLNNHPSVRAEPGFITFAMGRPMYDTVPTLPPSPFSVGVDGIALSADGSRLFYSAISSNKLYSVSTAALRNRGLSTEKVAETIQTVIAKQPSDGLEADAAGNIYATDVTSGGVIKIAPAPAVAGGYLITTLIHDPRMMWPDTLCLADNGYLYIMTNQLFLQPTLHSGTDYRQHPYVLYRMKLNVKPVRLQ